MDRDARRRLSTLPVDLVPLGWTLVPTHLEPTGHGEGPLYQVVYERPVEPEADAWDDETIARSGHVRVVGTSRASWDDAYWQAVAAMRQVDARCTP